MISFDSAETEYKVINPARMKRRLKALAASEGKTITGLSYTFFTDEGLLKYNQEYLQHDTYTDIITFDMSEDPESGEIEGDILISYERVLENATEHNATPEEEMQRVMAHGLLHLCGYGDKSEKEAATMRAKEEGALKLFKEVK
ncbi:MAG: rRNA maturation RNase YbeY [Bacteroidota bacterium]